MVKEEEKSERVCLNTALSDIVCVSLMSILAQVSLSACCSVEVLAGGVSVLIP